MAAQCRISMGCGSLCYDPLDLLRHRRDCLNLHKWRQTTEAVCVTFFLQIQIILWPIFPLSESKVLTTAPIGKQKLSIGQNAFLKLILAFAWSKAIIWSQVEAFFFLSNECLTLEQLMEMTAFPSIFHSFPFFMPRAMPAVVLYCRIWSFVKIKECNKV